MITGDYYFMLVRQFLKKVPKTSDLIWLVVHSEITSMNQDVALWEACHFKVIVEAMGVGNR